MYKFVWIYSHIHIHNVAPVVIKTTIALQLLIKEKLK